MAYVPVALRAIESNWQNCEMPTEGSTSFHNLCWNIRRHLEVSLGIREVETEFYSDEGTAELAITLSAPTLCIPGKGELPGTVLCEAKVVYTLDLTRNPVAQVEVLAKRYKLLRSDCWFDSLQQPSAIFRGLEGR